MNDDWLVFDERDMGTHIEKLVTASIGPRDENYERAKRLLAQGKRGEALRRLGGVHAIWMAYSKKDGGYIGSDELPVLIKHGVAPEKISPERSTCSIGFSEREQAWFGWSHRAVGMFQVGDVVKEEDTLLTSDDHQLGVDADTVQVGFECKTLDDCKRLAIIFAEAVA